MNNKNIMIVNDKKLYILLKEILNYEITFVEYRIEGDDFFEKVSIGKFDFIIVEENLYDFYNTLYRLNRMEIGIILFGYGIKGDILRNCFKQELILDYVEIDDYMKIEKVIEESKRKKVKYEKMIVKSDENIEVIINLDEINTISYDREARKSLIYTDTQHYFARRTLSEIEENLSAVGKFIRIERGYIVNLDKVDKIDNESCCIILKNKEKIYYSRSKLKEIKDIINSKMNVL